MPIAAALLGCVGGPACAQNTDGGLDLFSADTFAVSADLRLAAANGEESWTGGDFGKLRFGGDGHQWNGRASLAEAAIVWQPKLSWSLSGTIVALVQDNDGLQPGLSEAYLSWKPLGGGKIKLSGRAGLMWPRISLEHVGPQWSVADTITPSAINSWIGEEVKVVGAEGSASATLGEHRLTATGALFDVDDTAGALLSFRGWALHDLKALVGRKMKLPELGEEIEYYQPRYSHPLKEMDGGFLNRVGGYAQLAWQAPWRFRVELTHYDNNGDRTAANRFMEWGWHTSFDHAGVMFEPREGTRFVGQAISGQALMGLKEGSESWVDTRFRSAFALVSQQVGKASLSGRIESFATNSRGSYVGDEESERGWAATFAGKRPFGAHSTGLIELLHVSSRRDAREREGLPARQSQTMLQAALRLHW